MKEILNYERIIKLKKQGLTYREISIKMDCDYNDIQRTIFFFKGKAPQKRGPKMKNDNTKCQNCGMLLSSEYHIKNPC